MKLILANNQSKKFSDFYNELRSQSDVPFDYAGYKSLLFVFDVDAAKPVDVYNTQNGKTLADYDGVYINGYLQTYELAASVAIACDSLGLGYSNKEFSNPPSLSKLSMYARLAAGGVRLPRSLGGTKFAMQQAQSHLESFKYPAVLKRADADRGIDNYKVADFEEALKLLASQDEMSIWILQEYVENEGFYLVSFYDEKPVFSIFRSLQARPDNNQQKAHMYKPKGGANASLVPIDQLPKPILETCQKAVKVMNRQIASVDCLYDPASEKAYVLEVNYNPQLVTIETLKEVRVQAFLENIEKIGK